MSTTDWPASAMTRARLLATVDFPSPCMPEVTTKDCTPLSTLA